MQSMRTQNHLQLGAISSRPLIGKRGLIEDLKRSRDFTPWVLAVQQAG
jgi:hypothetical protein